MPLSESSYEHSFEERKASFGIHRIIVPMETTLVEKSLVKLVKIAEYESASRSSIAGLSTQFNRLGEQGHRKSSAKTREGKRRAPIGEVARTFPQSMQTTKINNAYRKRTDLARQSRN